MKYLTSPLAVVLFLIVDVGSALAASGFIPGSRVMVDLRFADSAGATQSITVPVTAASSDAAQTACGNKATLQKLASGVVARTPKLAGTKLISAACEVDGAGRPVLSPPQVPKPVPQAAPTYKHPAAIVIRYKYEGGVVLKAVLGEKSDPITELDDCPAYLQKYQTFLVKQVLPAHTKFVGASCVAAPGNVNSIMNSAN